MLTPLFVSIAVCVVLLILFEWNARRNPSVSDDAESARQDVPNATSKMESPDDGCCGEHLVCERETLLQTNAEVVYYDDEELDKWAGIAPEELPEEAENAIREVFVTLQGKDVPGWVRSLQLRNIALPPDIREEALLIVRERRHL